MGRVRMIGLMLSQVERSLRVPVQGTKLVHLRPASVPVLAGQKRRQQLDSTIPRLHATTFHSIGPLLTPNSPSLFIAVACIGSA